jgi:hypothetical protein
MSISGVTGLAPVSIPQQARDLATLVPKALTTRLDPTRQPSSVHYINGGGAAPGHSGETAADTANRAGGVNIFA